jgi:hypothetical protein
MRNVRKETNDVVHALTKSDRCGTAAQMIVLKTKAQRLLGDAAYWALSLAPAASNLVRLPMPTMLSVPDARPLLFDGA